MKKLLTSTLLTVVAIPFLSAAPNKAQNTTAGSQSTTANSTMQSTDNTAKKGKKHVKHVKKAVKSDTSSTAAPAASSTPVAKQ